MDVKLACILLYTSASILCVLGNLNYNFNPINTGTGCGVEAYKFLYFLHVPLERCILECGRRGRCKALNYRQYSSNFCELLETHVTTAVTDCFYLIRSDIDYGNQLSNACGCSLTESCDSETGLCSKTECSPVRTVTNGHIWGNRYKFGDSLAVICDTVYQPTNGTATITCLTTGAWDNTPSCQILCNAPGDLENGQYIGLDYSSGAIVYVTCDPDYRKINDVTSITCLNDGTWNESPQCVLKECGDPPTVENGGVIGSGRTIGTSLQITCDDGYREFDHVSSIRCLSSQLWDYTPQCVLKECGNPPSINYSSIATASVYTVGTVLAVTCDYGYSEVNGLAAITCTSSGDWDNTPICDVITCVHTISISHGSIYVGTYTVGQSASVYCDTNYIEQSGLTEIVCMATGTWDYIPNCVLQECPTPSIPNGYVTGNGYTVGSILNIQCNSGYTSNNMQITCVSSLSWLPAAECTQVVNCDSPWFEADGSCFYVTTSSEPEKKFSYAQSYCSNDLGGTGLARLDTEAKYNAVKSVLNGYSNTMNNYWIGAKRTAADQNMKWTDNNDNVGYHNYASGEPGTNDEHCAFLWKNDGWKWHNGRCSWSDRFVCEKSPN